jgi:hypothetical protein
MNARPVEPDVPVAIGPYLLAPLASLVLGVGAAIAGWVVFRPLRDDAWFAGAATGLGLATLVVVMAFVVGGGPNRRFLRRVASVLAAPGAFALGLGAVFVLNGALDRSPVTTHEARVVRVRETVEIESSGVNDLLVDVDDWRRPGTSLEVRYPHDEAPRGIAVGDTVQVKTRAGALGFERRVER